MNNEFKKSKSNNETRYVLENSATVTTGSVATAPSSLGKVQKRGNILAQEADKKKDAPKPRNFVAKNAKMGGAGKMQDKSKTIPRKEKHKKPVAEQGVAESFAEYIPLITLVGLVYAYLKHKPRNRQNFKDIPGFNYSDASASILKDVLPKVPKDDFGYPEFTIGFEGNLENLFKKSATRYFIANYGNERARMIVKDEAFMDRLADSLRYDLELAITDIQKKYKQGTAEGVRDLGYDAQSLIMKLRRDVEEKRLQPTPQAVLAAARELAGDMEFAPQLLVKQVLGQGMAEGFNAEYDDEAGMAHSNLLTTARAVMGLLKTIKDRDNLPEWGQEKIAKAEMMLVSVWDYLQSQKEMGNDPQQGVAEGFPKDPNAPKLVRDRKTGKQYDPNKEFEKKMNSPEVMAQMKRMAQKEGVEDRTSYQVAKILTDRGVKYDPAQENELINAIGMVLVKELNMTPKQARYLISYDEDFVSDTLGELRSMEQSVSEVSPPGWEKTVKAMKKHDEIDNPFALAWSMKNKGYKSHKKESADPYFESLASKLDQLKKK
jgi:hypothetical protein